MAKKVDVSAEITPEQANEVARGNFVTVSELAREINYSKRWVQHLIETGRITAVKPTGGHWRIPVSEVERITKTGIPPQFKKVEKPEEPNKVTVSGDHARRISAGQQRAEEEEEIRIRTVSDLFGLFRRKDEK